MPMTHAPETGAINIITECDDDDDDDDSRLSEQMSLQMLFKLVTCWCC